MLVWPGTYIVCLPVPASPFSFVNACIIDRQLPRQNERRCHSLSPSARALRVLRRGFLSYQRLLSATPHQPEASTSRPSPQPTSSPHASHQPPPAMFSSERVAPVAVLTTRVPQLVSQQRLNQPAGDSWSEVPSLVVPLSLSTLSSTGRPVRMVACPFTSANT